MRSFFVRFSYSFKAEINTVQKDVEAAAVEGVPDMLRGATAEG
jgi:SpoU rRNA methylase family enzyme